MLNKHSTSGALRRMRRALGFTASTQWHAARSALQYSAPPQCRLQCSALYFGALYCGALYCGAFVRRAL